MMEQAAIACMSAALPAGTIATAICAASKSLSAFIKACHGFGSTLSWYSRAFLIHRRLPRLLSGAGLSSSHRSANSHAAVFAAWAFTSSAWAIADVFVGGVIYTRVALAMELTSAWLGLEPGRKLLLPLGLLLWYHGLWQRQVWYQRKSAAPPPQAKGLKLASGGIPPNLPRLMLGSPHQATRRLPGRMPSGV